MGIRLWAVLALLAVPLSARGASMDGQELRALLEQLHQQEVWGEAVLADGRVRDIRVDSLGADSVAVREVVGPLFERREVYALGQIRSLRELGPQRIPARGPVYRPQKSMTTALVLETLVPGAGYFYIGDGRQGLALLGLAAAVVGTGIATGEDGAAGWVPLSVWIKVASLFNLRDEVSAINHSGAGLAVEAGPTRGGVVLRARLAF